MQDSRPNIVVMGRFRKGNGLVKRKLERAGFKVSDKLNGNTCLVVIPSKLNVPITRAFNTANRRRIPVIDCWELQALMEGNMKEVNGMPISYLKNGGEVQRNGAVTMKCNRVNLSQWTWASSCLSVSF